MHVINSKSTFFGQIGFRAQMCSTGASGALLGGSWGTLVMLLKHSWNIFQHLLHPCACSPPGVPYLGLGTSQSIFLHLCTPAVLLGIFYAPGVRLGHSWAFFTNLDHLSKAFFSLLEPLTNYLNVY